MAVLICVGAGIVIGRYQGSITTTRTVHVARSWGKPDTVVDGGQVNAQLAGWRCEIYAKRQVVLCHR